MIIKYLDPKTDFAFKKIFRRDKNKDLLIGLINAVLRGQLHKPVVAVSIVPTNLDPEMRTSKESYIDVLCQDQDGCQYIIEMQVAKEKGFEKRAQFYASRTFVDQMKAGEVYHNLKKVIFLAFTDHILFPDKSHYKSEHITLDKESREHDLDLISFTFVELPKFDQQRPREVEKLTLEEKLYYFLLHAPDCDPEEVRNLIGKDRLIQRAFDELNIASFTDAELQEYREFEKYQRDTSVRNNRIKEEGRAEGIAEGIVEGAKTRAIEIAKQMLAEGEALAKIKRYTGLSEEEISALKGSI